MAEDSFLWTTGGAGDGSATYTRADWSRIGEVMAACAGWEGVAAGYKNVLAGSVGGANTYNINTGGGVVDGKPYHNTASVGVNIPSAVGGGNERIDRIVLRADWSAQTVRITRIAGTDEVSPSAPAITQTPGTTYDIMLYQVRVDTSGVVTTELDERVWAAVETDGIQDDAVDDDKVGNRVPMLTRRQGGHATNWPVSGGTDYTPTAVKIQAGTNISGSISPESSGTKAITFPQAFSASPIVLLLPKTVQMIAYVTNESTTGFTANFYNENSSTPNTCGFNWIAIGPE